MGAAAFLGAGLLSSAASTGLNIASNFGEDRSSEIEALLKSDVQATEHAREERMRQQELEQVLARQELLFTAAGIDPSQGSAARLARAQTGQAKDESDLAKAMLRLSRETDAFNLYTQRKARKKERLFNVLGESFGFLGGAAQTGFQASQLSR